MRVDPGPERIGSDPRRLSVRFTGFDIASRWNGVATIDYWTGYEWTKGSYSYWKVGQYTRFGGAEGEISGAVHFCGEHTSQDFQGYLQGGVETGMRAAKEVLAAI